MNLHFQPQYLINPPPLACDLQKPLSQAVRSAFREQPAQESLLRTGVAPPGHVFLACARERVLAGGLAEEDTSPHHPLGVLLFLSVAEQKQALTACPGPTAAGTLWMASPHPLRTKRTGRGGSGGATGLGLHLAQGHMFGANP